MHRRYFTVLLSCRALRTVGRFRMCPVRSYRVSHQLSLALPEKANKTEIKGKTSFTRITDKRANRNKREEQMKKLKADEARVNELLESLHSGRHKKNPRTPEQQKEDAARIKAYAKRKAYHQNAILKDEKNKKDLQCFAINEMPPELREEAIIPDESPIPDFIPPFFPYTPAMPKAEFDAAAGAPDELVWNEAMGEYTQPRRLHGETPIKEFEEFMQRVNKLQEDATFQGKDKPTEEVDERKFIERVFADGVSVAFNSHLEEADQEEEAPALQYSDSDDEEED
eukprot:TRINITY_DN8458_c0_g1_i2.p1 TRINITY_DN8458_c0_g1~~TRINITY_DN8458_c0_g1_i2.p1  ORF type:complete len:283 (-),score=74.44 TRINITY_DN8458_c0_g1_i2:13-861(-)